MEFVYIMLLVFYFMAESAVAAVRKRIANSLYEHGAECVFLPAVFVGYGCRVQVSLAEMAWRLIFADANTCGLFIYDMSHTIHVEQCTTGNFCYALKACNASMYVT